MNTQADNLIIYEILGGQKFQKKSTKVIYYKWLNSNQFTITFWKGLTLSYVNVKSVHMFNNSKFKPIQAQNPDLSFFFRPSFIQ